MVYRRDEVEKNAFFIGIFFQSSLQLQQHLAVSENVTQFVQTKSSPGKIIFKSEQLNYVVGQAEF